MNELLNAAFELPTAIFSFLLIPVVCYWLLVILGALDLDVLDGVFDGAFETLDGGAEGAIEAFEGADVGDGSDGGSTTGLLAGLLAAVGLSGIPITVSLSFLVLFGWFLTFTGTQLLGGAGLGGLWVGAAVLILASGLALVATGLVVRPLRRFFTSRSAMGRGGLVGRLCTVTTRRVDDRFGQAEVADDSGASMVVQVRSAEAGNVLTRGSKALIFDYDRAREVFLVAPAGGELAGTEKKLDS